MLYYSDDPIENLRIRITITDIKEGTMVYKEPKTFQARILAEKHGKQNAKAIKSMDSAGLEIMKLARAAKNELLEEKREQDEQKDSSITAEHNRNRKERERHSFAWQEKRFSTREVLQYGPGVSKSATDQVKKYADQVGRAHPCS